MQQVDAARSYRYEFDGEPEDPEILAVARDVVAVLTGDEPYAHMHDRQGWLDILDFEGVSEHVAILGKSTAARHAREVIYEYATDREYRQ